MLSNYLTIALRSMARFKAYSIINLAGLALGLTAGILILLYVLDELSYDAFHTKGDRIYRVETQFFDVRSGPGGSNETNGWPVGNILRNEFPEVEAVLYSRRSWFSINYNGKKLEQKMHFVSPEFFQMFTFPLVKGNAVKALAEPYSVVITEAMERKYFPGGDALNKTLTMNDTLSFVVTGVMKEIPSYSHIQVDMLLSFSTYPLLDTDFSYDDGWGNINVRNYVLLKEGADAEAFFAKAKNLYTERAGTMLKDWGVSANVVFMPLKKLYLHARNGNGLGPLGSIDRLYLVSGIAAAVILLACINFINLSTARSVYRAREVGLRKVVGSTRRGLIRQFLSESFVLTTAALFLAIALTGLSLPVFNQLLGKSYSLQSLLDPAVAGGITVLMFLVTFLSGYYPAWVMSGMKPAEVLKGKMQSSARGVRLRRALVVFQFVISAGLVMGTLIVIGQLDFMQKQELGFAKDEILVVNAAGAHSENPDAHTTFGDEIRSLAVVEKVTFTNALPGNPGWMGQVAYPEGRSGDDAVTAHYMAIDENYIDALGLQVIAGRGFDLRHEAELKDGLVLNEAAVAAFGWGSPQEAIGKKITSPSGYPEGEVIGVVKDYHDFGLQQKIGPMTMDYAPRNSYLYAIRYKAADTRQLIESVNGLWKKHFPSYDFHYFFLDQDFERQYQAEQRLARVLAIFAVLTIVIAVIGLSGLASFMVVSRTKEIGVRKVLGAQVMQIVSLLSREFLILVVVANVIAIPLVWYWADEWLQGFATHDTVNPLVFIITVAVAIAVTLVTTGFQTIKAATADPVSSLRQE